MHEAVKTDVDIVLIQEPNTRKGLLRGFNGYSVFQFKTTEDRVKAAVLIKTSTMSAIGITHLSSANIAVITTTFRKRRLFIASVYIEPREDPNATMTSLRRLLSAAGEDPVVIGGDFNAKHPFWGTEHACTRGEQLADLADDHDLTIINHGCSPTYETIRNERHITSIIDITLASPSISHRITDWRVDPTFKGSGDHHAIIFDLRTSAGELPLPKRTSTFKWNVHKADWETFHKICNRQLAMKNLTVNYITEIEDPNDLHQVAEDLTSIINAACKKAMPKLKTRTHYCPFWNEDLTKLRAEVHRTHHRLSQAKARGEDLSEYLNERTTMKTLYKEALQKTAANSFKQFCENQKDDNVWAFVRKIIAVAPSRKPPATIEANGIQTTSPQSSAEALLLHFYEDAKTKDAPEKHCYDNPHSEDTLSDDEVPFTEQEVLHAIRTMSAKKAPGEDHITADIYLRFAEGHIALLTAIYNRCLELAIFPEIWKRAEVRILKKPGREDQSSLSSFRPIGLLSVLGKTLEKLFRARLTYYLETSGLISPRQYGFREQRSTTDALHDAMAVVDLAKTLHEEVIAVSLDIRAAFDNAHWPLLLSQLRRYRCPRNIYRLICNYHEDRTVSIKYAGASATKTMTKGCVQGSVCGPTFWNLVLEELLAKTMPEGCHLQAFADDLLLIARGTKTKLKTRVELALAMIVEWGEKAQLEFSTTKTQAIAFTHHSRGMTFKMKTEDLKPSKTMKVLGVTIDHNRTFLNHLKTVISKTQSTYANICKVIRPTWGTSPKIIETIYRAIVEPIITYGSSIWGTVLRFKKAKTWLKTIQRRFAIKATKAFSTASANATIALAGFTPLHLRIREIAEITNTKRTGTTTHLPKDRHYQRRLRPEHLPHPSQRISTEYTKLDDPSQARTIWETSDYTIFTDGSKREDLVGCAYVVFDRRLSPVEPKLSKKFKLAPYCTSYQAELFALGKAVEWTSGLHPTTPKTIAIVSDCQSALSALRNSNATSPLVFAIHNGLRRTNHRISFYWTRGHTGTYGNELADRAAAKGAGKRTQPDYDLFPLSFVKAKNRQMTLEDWDREFREDPHGAVLRSLLKTIAGVQEWRRKIDTNFYVTQALTGHGFNKSYLVTRAITVDDLCPCDNQSRQDLGHLLTECDIFTLKTSSYRKLCNDENVNPMDFASVITRLELAKTLRDTLIDIFSKLKPINGT